MRKIAHTINSPSMIMLFALAHTQTQSQWESNAIGKVSAGNLIEFKFIFGNDKFDEGFINLIYVTSIVENARKKTKHEKL